jgi:hypothetical protein
VDPFVIAKHQCYTENKASIFVAHVESKVDYYGISMGVVVVDQDVKKGTILSVTKTEPFHILKQVAFYNKCKEVHLEKERYMYAKMLAEQLAEVDQPTKVAKPAIRNNYNCFYQQINWKMDIHGHKVQGSSVCLVASKDIKRGEVLLYKQGPEEQRITRASILDRYPLMFHLGNKSLFPKNDIDVPIYLDGQLTNFMHVKEKNGPYVIRFPDIDAYENTGDARPRREVYLKFVVGSGYKIVKIINPDI